MANSEDPEETLHKRLFIRVYTYSRTNSISRERNKRRIFIIYNTINIDITHSSRMEFPTLISWTSPFLNQGLYGGVYIFIQILIEPFIKNREDPDQTPKNS